MILGWSWPDTDLPMVTATSYGPVALLEAACPPPDARAAGLAQTRAAQRLSSFLPCASPLLCAPEQARVWTAAHADHLARRLDALKLTAQISLHMTKTQSAKPKATDGATWLQQKAQDHRRLSQDRVDTLEPVTKALGPLALRDQKLRTHRNGLALDLLVDRKTVDHVLLTLAEGLRQNGPRDLLGWACALVGPLPVYSFAEAA